MCSAKGPCCRVIKADGTLKVLNTHSAACHAHCCIGHCKFERYLDIHWAVAKSTGNLSLYFFFKTSSLTQLKFIVHSYSLTSTLMSKDCTLWSLLMIMSTAQLSCDDHHQQSCTSSSIWFPSLPSSSSSSSSPIYPKRIQDLESQVLNSAIICNHCQDLETWSCKELGMPSLEQKSV